MRHVVEVEGKHVARRETNPAEKATRSLNSQDNKTMTIGKVGVLLCLYLETCVADPREIALSQSSKSEF